MEVSSEELDPEMRSVLESAARLQELVPDAVLVGNSAAAVLTDLRDRFDVVLEALESEGGWVTNRVHYGKVILGQLGDIEAGVRQLIRRTPMEVREYVLPSGAHLRVPTVEETLRVKAFLALRRNQTRDYLDIAALSEAMGVERAAEVLSGIDGFYADQRGEGEGVASQVARQLSEPKPADSAVTRQLSNNKSLQPQWHQWVDVMRACQRLADEMLRGDKP